MDDPPDDYLRQIDDPLGLDDAEPPEPSPARRIAMMALATADMDRRLAMLQDRIANPSGPRQTKRRQRRAFFDALRAGATRAEAAARAGITSHQLDEWMTRASFRQSADRAELDALHSAGVDLGRW